MKEALTQLCEYLEQGCTVVMATAIHQDGAIASMGKRKKHDTE